ncbi:MAG TPA: hypothetical protein VFT99_09455, partial [Roseiflexaceae bacterium]|nr:hypothetical protein [Roseiflexaceae bacterium]
RELRIRTDGPPGRRFGLELVQIIVNALFVDLHWPTGQCCGMIMARCELFTCNMGMQVYIVTKFTSKKF